MSGPLQAAVIVVSDRCARGEETDRTGPILEEGLKAHGIATQTKMVVPDSVPSIRAAISDALTARNRLVIVAGGTGVSPKDHTPEAVAPFLATPLPGIDQYLMAESLKQTPYAAFGRGRSGLSAADPKALIVTQPGSRGAAATTVEALLPLLAHFFEQLDSVPPQEGAYVAHPGTA